MRLRNNPNTKKILDSNTYYFIDQAVCIATKQTFHKNDSGKLRYLEIGIGKGQFILQQAINHPEINFFGIERNPIICAKAITKFNQHEHQLNNLRITNLDAKHLLEVLPLHSIDKLYLNFSDPWPKKRHAKNRLTHPNYLNLWNKLLKADATIEMKTDNESLFQYTLDTICEIPNIKIVYQTRDLYNDFNNSCNRHNVASEYEMKFSKIKNINKLIFKYINKIT